MLFVPAQNLRRLSACRKDVPGQSQDIYVDTFYLFVGQTFDVSSHDVWFFFFGGEGGGGGGLITACIKPTSITRKGMHIHPCILAHTCAGQLWR